MEAPLHNSAQETQGVERCLRDIDSLLSLPVASSSIEPSEIVGVLFDSLMRMLRLDFAYLRCRGEDVDRQIEMVRVSESGQPALPSELGEALDRALGEDTSRWPSSERVRVGSDIFFLACVRLGIEADLGITVAACRRPDFPTKTDMLILRIAANRALVGLEGALRLERKRAADDFDRRLAHRTRELREMIDTMPALAGSAHPDGSAEFLNRRWMDSSLQRQLRRTSSTPAKSGMIVKCRRAFHLLSTMCPGSSAR